MDSHSLWSLHGLKLGIKERTLSIPKGSLGEVGSSLQKKIQPYQRLWGGGIFLVLALGMGQFANDLSQRAGARSWEKSHPPSQSIVQYSLKSRGLRLIQNPVLLQKIFRTIPASIDDEGSIWLSQDANWFAYFLDSEKALPAHIYCLQCEHLPSYWKPIGIGWQALEEALSGIDQRIALQKSTQKKNPLPRDPREIFY